MYACTNLRVGTWKHALTQSWCQFIRLFW